MNNKLMNKKAIIIIIVIILAAALFFLWYSTAARVTTEPTIVPEGIILFYGQGCPHCKNVEDFIVQNNIEDSVKFTMLEVWYNKDNQVPLAEVVQKCGINSNEVGVPFLFDGGSKCYIGDIDIINFFKDAAKIK